MGLVAPFHRLRSMINQMVVQVDGKSAHAIMRCETMLQRKMSRHKEMVIRELARQGDKWAQEQVAVWDNEDGKKEFPLYRPDGEDIQSVSEVAAMLGVKENVAAHYVLEQKGLDPEVYRQAKELSAPPQSDHDGVAIMLQPSPNEAAQIAIQGGTLPSDLHCTVGYFGNLDEVNFDQSDLMLFAQRIASNFDPISVSLNGITRFSGDDSDPLVVNCDSPYIELMRAMVVRLCAEEVFTLKSEHGYTPHMTLGYLDPTDPMPFERWTTRQVMFESLLIGYGSSNVTVPLGMSPETKDIYTGKNTGDMGKPGRYATSPGIPPRHAMAHFVRRAKKIRRRIGYAPKGS